MPDERIPEERVKIIERRVRLISKLRKMTEDKEITWRQSDVMIEGIQPPFDIYEAQTNNLTFRTYQERVKKTRYFERSPSALSSISSALFGSPSLEGPGSYVFETIVTRLEVLSEHDGGREIFTDEGDIPSLRALYSVVRKSVTSIDADIEAFIGQEERHAERHHG